MLRRLALGLSLSAIALAPAAAADMPGAKTRIVAEKRVSVRGWLVCPDTHCGQRRYPDPYIGDGWRGPRHERPWPDVRTWHLMRSWPVIYLGETPVAVTRMH